VRSVVNNDYLVRVGSAHHAPDMMNG
jgi:hypothetical protein